MSLTDVPPDVTLLPVLYVRAFLDLSDCLPIALRVLLSRSRAFMRRRDGAAALKYALAHGLRAARGARRDARCAVHRSRVGDAAAFSARKTKIKLRQLNKRRFSACKRVREGLMYTRWVTLDSCAQQHSTCLRRRRRARRQRAPLCDCRVVVAIADSETRRRGARELARAAAPRAPRRTRHRHRGAPPVGAESWRASAHRRPPPGARGAGGAACRRGTPRAPRRTLRRATPKRTAARAPHPPRAVPRDVVLAEPAGGLREDLLGGAQRASAAAGDGWPRWPWRPWRPT